MVSLLTLSSCYCRIVQEKATIEECSLAQQSLSANPIRQQESVYSLCPYTKSPTLDYTAVDKLKYLYHSDKIGA